MKNYRIIEGPENVQGSPEWHEFRKGKIGASDIASILGISPWETKLQCWERIVFDQKRPVTKAMQRGHDLEEKARKRLINDTGINYQPAVLQSVAHTDLIASLDGFVENYTLPSLIAEIKCPNRETHELAKKGIIPDYYIAQMHHQMDLAGVKEMLYVSFDGEIGVTLEVHRDEELSQKIFKEVLSFLASMISFKPPSPTERDWIECNDPNMIVKSFRYKELTALIDELEVEREAIKQYLTSEIDHPRAIVGDMKMTRVTRKGNIDVDKLIKDYEIHDSENYRKPPTTNWRLTFN